MIEKVQEFLRGPAGKVVAVVLFVGGCAWAYQSFRGFNNSEAAKLSRDRTFICTETLKAFEYTVKIGDSIPVPSPFSGKRTGVPAEFCYWTKDGKIKSEPTPVALNQHLNKQGPTFCPDCGRLVVSFNPAPVQGEPPPPTEAEYKAKGGGQRVVKDE